jgi:hypothetical protein
VTVSGGYIKLYRQIQDHEIWRDPVRAFAWIDLLMLASFNGHTVRIKNRPIEIERGDVVVSFRFLQKRWKWGSRKTQRFIGWLLRDRMMTEKQHGSGHGSPSIYTIVNYDRYQGSDIDDQHGSRHASSTLPAHFQHETKKVKKEKKNTSALRRTFSDLHIGESRKSSGAEEEFDEEAAQKSLEKELEETEARLRSKPNLTKKEKRWLEIRARKKKQEKTKND